MRIFVLFFISVLGAGWTSMANAEPEADKMIEFNLENFSLRDPFKSQLPFKEQKKIKDKIVKSAKIKPTPTSSIVKKKPVLKSVVQKVKAVEKVKKNISPPMPSLNANISGLIWNSDKPQAIVNGKVIEIGDTVNGMEVVDITKSGIYVQFLQKVFKIKTQGEKE